MRGIPSLITDIRKQVFAEWRGWRIRATTHRWKTFRSGSSRAQILCTGSRCFSSVRLRARRVRLAMGLSLQPVQTRTLLTEGMDQAAIAEQY